MKLFKSRKALSPVVASIILIAVTVAVSIAVAAWMGALTIGFMGTSSLTITDLQFSGTSGQSGNTIVVHIRNSGTKQVTIAKVHLNGVDVTTKVSGKLTYAAGETGNFTISNVGWVSGNPYEVKLFDASNNPIGASQENAPS
ncbi:MAG: archaellin/type IV pilin N-terminal domain-containing protein [Candidatus Bathyarchaeia archaeon]